MADENNIISAIKPILESWISKVAQIYGYKLPVASGKLKDNVEPFTESKDNELVAGLKLLSYWENIEHGRSTGSKSPPINAILEWIRYRNIIPDPFRLPSGRDVIPTERQLAYLIGRKISIEGIEPKPFLGETIDELKNELVDMIREEIGREVYDRIKIMFE